MITGSATVDYAENGAADVGAYSAEDPEGAVTTLALGGTDASSFNLTNGVLSFNNAPDYETKNSYSITFTATDQTSNTATLDVTVRITNVVEAGEMVISGSDTLSIGENSATLLLETYTATNTGGAGVTWTLEGSDKDDFTLTGGALSLKASPDYETKSEYAVTVKAASGNKRATLNVAVTVNNVNEAPIFHPEWSVSEWTIDEHYVDPIDPWGFTVLDDPGDQITFALAGDDADKFSFSEWEPWYEEYYYAVYLNVDCENPDDADADSDNVYEVTLQATDANGTAEFDVEVTVRCVDETPAITGPATVTYAENGTADVGSYSAEDPEGETTTLVLGGTDASSFTFTKGVLRFNNAPDYEAKSSYSVTITATDQTNNSATLDVTVWITNVVEAGEIGISGSDTPSIDENSTTLFLETYTATNTGGADVTWTLEGADKGDFTLASTATGQALSLKASPDYEAKKTYWVDVQAASGNKRGARRVTVTVANVDEAPVIIGRAEVHRSENGATEVGAYSAEDPEGATTTLALRGTDAASFNFTNGTLSFNNAPDYETKSSYSVTFTATDQTNNAATLDVTVWLRNEIEAGEMGMTGSDTLSIDENSTNLLLETYTASSGGAVTWTLEGADKGDFTFGVTTTGRALFLKASPDYETKSAYAVTLKAQSGDRTGVRNVAVTVIDVYEGPTITSGPTFVRFLENGTGTVGTYSATDPDGDSIVWTVEGPDAGKFSIDMAGALKFNAPPDYESPGDADGNNFYEVTVKATANAEMVLLSVGVRVANDSKEAPKFYGVQNSVNARENAGPDVNRWSIDVTEVEDVFSISLTGADADSFTVEPVYNWARYPEMYKRMRLILKAAPDYENPDDANGDGVYEVTLRATDNYGTGELDVTVTVTDGDDAPVITGPATVSYAENGTADVGAYSAADPEGATTTLALGGADASSFTFTNGTLSFNNAPDYETKNSYSLTFTATDQTNNSATLDVTVAITNVVEAGEIEISGSDTLSIDEKSTNLLLETYTAINPDGGAVTWKLEGTDKDDFTLASTATGQALGLSASPDYETKARYAVTVKAESSNRTGVRNVAVTVTDVYEGLTITSGPTFAHFDEGTTGLVGTYTAVDTENGLINWSVDGQFGDSTIVYPDLDGGNARRETIELHLSSRLNYESRKHYRWTLTATAGDRSDTRVVDIFARDVEDEALRIIAGPAGVNVRENGTAVASYTARNPLSEIRLLFGGWTVEGADAGKFTIEDFAGGLKANLNFKAEPDFESPGDADEDNQYQVTVKVTASNYGRTQVQTDTRDVIVTVTDWENEPVPGRVTVITATATDQNTVSLTWTAPSDGETVTGYRILRRAVDSETDFQTLSQNTGNTNTTWTDSNLTPHTKYAYRVHALGAYGAGPISALAEVLTPRVPGPGRITALTAMALDHDTVLLTWVVPSEGSAITGYKILRRAVDSESSFQTLTQNTGNTTAVYTDRDLSPRTRYAYRVVALDRQGEGQVSELASVITPVAEVPGQVTGLTATAAVHNQVSLGWTAPSDGATVTGYRIWRRAVGSESSYQTHVQNTGNTDTTYTDSSNVEARIRYSYRVLALGAHGVGERSAAAVVMTPAAEVPGQVTGLMATAAVHNQVSLGWTAPSDGATVTGYRIWRRAVDSESSYQTLVQNTGHTDTTYTDSNNVKARTKYAYRVQALGANGAGERSTLASVITPLVAMPGQVTGLTAAATVNKQVSLSWTAPSDGATVTGYRIWRRAVDSESGYQTLVQNTGNTDTTYTDSNNVKARTKYAYRVQALGANGAGERSTPATVITPLGPGQVTGLTATATHDTVSLTWNAPSDGAEVTGYRIWRRAVDSESSQKVLTQYTGTTTEYQDSSNVNARTTYTYRVQALGDRGAGELSRLVSVTTPLPPVPGQVTGLTATATHDTVSLSWTAPSDGAEVTGYRILRRVMGSEDSLQVKVQNTGNTSTTWTDDNVNTRTSYAYRVQALGEHGAGELSAQVSVTTPLPPVPGQVKGLTATVTEDDMVSLSWSAPSDGAEVTGYRIWRRAMGSENSLQVVVQNIGKTNTTWIDNNVSTGTGYAYRVQALGDHGAGELSAPATVTTPE